MASGTKKRSTITRTVPYDVLNKFIVVEANIAKIHATKITTVKTPENGQVKYNMVCFCYLTYNLLNKRYEIQKSHGIIKHASLACFKFPSLHTGSKMTEPQQCKDGGLLYTF